MTYSDIGTTLYRRQPLHGTISYLRQSGFFVVKPKTAEKLDSTHPILWDDLLIRLLMRLREPPPDDEIRERAHRATETLF